jgi:glycogen(starch) synthase
VKWGKSNNFRSMKKIRVLLASLLKPINDTRMYGKLGCTLASWPPAEVHVCGYEAQVPTAPDTIRFHPLFRFRRLSPDRLWAPIRYLRFLFRLRPHLIVVGTHELLLPSVLYKLIAGGHLIYDIRENYALNLRSQRVYPPGVRQVLAGLVRLTERVCARWVDHHLLAEQSYARELPFLGQRFTIVENKASQPTSPQTKKGISVKLENHGVRLLYSGTISRLNGVFEAVELCRRLREAHPRVELVIIGYCAQPEVLEELQAAMAGKPYISLIGGNRLVPHPDILAAIRQSDVGLLPYRPHPSTFSCIPTKLYEYMGHGLPLLLQENPAWRELVSRHHAGLFLDFAAPDPIALLARLAEATFYPEGVPEEVYWENEAPKFLRAVREIMDAPA